MNFSYILQTKDLCIMIFFGFVIGIIYTLINIPNLIKKILTVRIICDILFSLLFTLVFLLLINLINNGELRMFLLFGYCLGFLIERITLGKTFAKCFQNMYTLIVKWLKIFSKSKIGRYIFK